MKCPFCGSKGARVNGRLFDPEAMIHTAIDCHNTECSCYKSAPIKHPSAATIRPGSQRPASAGIPIRFSRWLAKIQPRHLP